MILKQSPIIGKNDTTSHEGSMIDAVTSNYGLRQLIQEPTSILNSSSSYIDLIFTSQPNLVMESDPKLIRRAFNEFDWIRALSNVTVDEKVCYFTKTLLNIIHNFIPNEIIVCGDRDPPWINNEIKKLINEKNSAYKS